MYGVLVAQLGLKLSKIKDKKNLWILFVIGIVVGLIFVYFLNN